MRKEVVVKIKMPKDMYDDFVDTYYFEKGTQHDKGETLEEFISRGIVEEFISRGIVETVAENFVFVVKDERL